MSPKPVFYAYGDTKRLAAPVSSITLPELKKMLRQNDKWRYEVKDGGRYWRLRERRRNGKTLYGGKFDTLPDWRRKEYFENVEKQRARRRTKINKY